MIKAHIESFNPTVSHYRRVHEPKRRYLPSDITITFMHPNFREKFPEMSCGYETYRSVVKDMRISFTKLGEEECETCLKFNVTTHDHSQQAHSDSTQAQASLEEVFTNIPTVQDIAIQSENPSNGEERHNNEILQNQDDSHALASNSADHEVTIQLEGPTNEDTQNKEKRAIKCNLCEEFQEHKKRVKNAREHYQRDAERQENDTSIRSVDLQKVIMLPRMPGCKSACFTKRIIAFHLTFAYLGKGRGKRNISFSGTKV